MIEIPEDSKFLKGMTFIDLFAGLGGFRLALESLGAECVWSNEIDKQACEVYKRNFGEDPLGDITQVKAENVPDHDIIAAGFPCLTGDTMVLCENGQIRLDEIVPGMKVVSDDGKLHEVINFFKQGQKETYRLSTKMTPEIRATGNHRFLCREKTHCSHNITMHMPYLTEPEWMTVENICDAVNGKHSEIFFSVPASAENKLTGWQREENDSQVFIEDGYIWFPIHEIENTGLKEQVYDIEVEETHTFIANNLITHNCQAFSISGSQRGFADSRGTLFFDVARIVKEKKPKIVFMENVRNFAQHDEGRTIAVVKATMEDLGYSFDWACLPSNKYGAATKRERVYMVCFRNDLNVKDFQFPEECGAKSHVKDHLLSDTDSTVKDLYKPATIVSWDQGYKDKQKTVSDVPVRLGTVGNGGQGQRVYSINGTAITFSAHGGGLFAKTGGYLINGQVRALAPREAARIMGYPDTYVLPCSRSQSLQQIGNSVVIDVLQRVALEFARAYAKSLNQH